MAKISINAAPTFAAKVLIPVAGSVPVEMVFTFKHRTKDQLNAFTTSRADKTDTESMMDMVSGWDFAEPFTVESVEVMLQNYIGAAACIYRAYIDELVQARAKN